MANASVGGVFRPDQNVVVTGTWDFQSVPSTASGTLVTTTGTQTLSGKTLTSPAVTGLTGTLTAPVLTTPTITALTEVVTATNVITAAESGSVFFLNAAT